jgi:hypothetical protein
MAVPTTLDPWREQGIPLEKQFRSWKEIVKSPYGKLDVAIQAQNPTEPVPSCSHVASMRHDSQARR